MSGRSKMDQVGGGRLRNAAGSVTSMQARRGKKRETSRSIRLQPTRPMEIGQRRNKRKTKPSSRRVSGKFESTKGGGPGCLPVSLAKSVCLSVCAHLCSTDLGEPANVSNSKMSSRCRPLAILQITNFCECLTDVSDANQCLDALSINGGSVLAFCRADHQQPVRDFLPQCIASGASINN